jgi:tRNA 5-methylaminomethyl-2-thiouridine biosynthesis bifunctional protein
MPLASGGYVLPLPDGRLLFGATRRDDDDDRAVRVGDHADNLARVAAWFGDAALPDPATLAGRVGWRAVTPDRLPLVGPVPALDAPRPARADAPRLLPRQAGLWLHSGLGARGLTTGALGAELLAARASGAPWPLEADLADAIDPARWLVRDRVA